MIKAITTLQAYSATKIKKFRKEEDGLALTEYLVVLGLLVGGVIVAVGLFGDALSDTWDNWTTWVGGLDDNVVAAPAAP
ncbi:Flp family type IVb pilin [Seohaeicola saemankumensis]|uniref:Flp family type IVb pilin n=1 Tax=Seohaeicola saemankumensis TaxID=481181 RepID=A0ABW3TH88_9RHOB